MRCSGLFMSIGILFSSPCLAEPTEVFGGEFAISDSSSGFTIDVNADGVFDINFAYFGVSVNSIFGWDGVVRGVGGLSDARFAASLDGNDRFVHQRLGKGDVVGAGVINDSSSGAIAYESFYDGFAGGPWIDQGIGYVGFSFLADEGQSVHYGWAEVQIDNSGGTDDGFLVLYRIAYETVPGVSIEAGDPFGCNDADLAAPFDELNFFDVSAFLSAFSASDPDADINGDGMFNFFDVSEFLIAFNDGCP